jgi:hypothetical protein
MAPTRTTSRTRANPSIPRAGNYGGAVPVSKRGPRAGLPKLIKANPREHLTENHLAKILNAEGFAAAQKMELSVHLTIHWRRDPAFMAIAQAGDPEALSKAWSKRLTRFFDKLSRWLTRNSIPVAFAWVNEVGREYGEHTHVLLHLPHPRKLKKPMTFGILKAELIAHIYASENLADGIDKRGKEWIAVKVTGGSFGMRVAKMRAGITKYWAKSLSANELIDTGHGVEKKADRLGIRPKRNAALILNKRCGASQSLRLPARQQAGWTELTTLEELYERLHPE